MGHRAAERITKSRIALSKVCFSERLHVSLIRTHHPARKLVRRHHSSPLLINYAPYLSQVAKSMPGLAGGAVFGALLGYRIG